MLSTIFRFHPSLYFAYALALGYSCAFFSLKNVALPLLFFSAVSVELFRDAPTLRKYLLAALCIGIAGFAYVTFEYNAPRSIRKGFDGTALLRIESVMPSFRSFSKGLEYRGTLISFDCDHPAYTKIKNAPFVYYQGKKLKPLPKSEFIQVDCNVKQPLASSTYQVKIKNDSSVRELSSRLSLAHIRLQSKEELHRYLFKKLKDAKVSSFICGVISGYYTDRSSLKGFKQCGLAHLLAISGFHFHLLATCLTYSIDKQKRGKVVAFLLLILLGSYFAFLGSGPSIIRAFLCTTVFCICKVLDLRITSLQILGASIFLSLLYNPLFMQAIGFHLSCLLTFAILLLFPLLQNFLSRSLPFLPKRLCQFLSLTLAIHFMALPTTLYYFGYYPLISPLMNLFMPFLLIVALLLLVLALLVPSWPLLAVKKTLFFLCTFVGQWMLKIPSLIPLTWQYTLRSPTIDSTAFLAVLHFFLILSNKALKKNHEIM